ncbi:HAD hydrolase-like protein [uncultured Sutterella sp.]|uniref:HAD family hydrolase n=1 Tax=uncultured Sutterella sp. TaxID=286133 RepID=UPI0025EB7161|nr:HAD hydrolase-like protein [uncultured Sutterella sp.]
MLPRLFLFDLDGTLVDSAPDLGGAANDMLAARGRPELPLEELRVPAGHGAPALLKRAFSIERDDPRFPELRDEFLRNYVARGVSHSSVYAGVRELLEGLREMGVASGVVTNKPHELALKVCDELALTPLLATIVGVGIPGTEVKPLPGSLLKALADLGAQPEAALYAGDSTTDGLAAHAAGMPFAWVSWGCQPEAPEAGVADFIAREPADLLVWAMRRGKC